MQKYKNQWIVLLLMMMAWGSAGIAHNCIAYLFPFFSERFSMGVEHNGYLSGTLALFWCMSIMICGKLLARFKAQLIMCCGLLIAGVSFCLLSQVESIHFVYIFIALAGLGCGTVVPTSFALLTEYSDPKRRGMFFGAAQSSYTLIGAAIGTVIFTRLANTTIGWQGSFTIIGVILFLVLILIFFSRHRLFYKTKTEEEKRKSSLKDVLRYKDVILTTVLACLAMMWYFTTASYGIIYLISTKGITAVQAGAIFSGFGIGGFIGEFGGPSLSDYLGRKRTAFMLVALGGLSFLAFLRFDASQWVTAFLLAAASCFMSGAMIILNSVIPSESVPEALSARATSFTPAMGEFVGGVFAPIVVGLLTKNAPIESIMYGIACLPILVCVGVFFLKETLLHTDQK